MSWLRVHDRRTGKSIKLWERTPVGVPAEAISWPAYEKSSARLSCCMATATCVQCGRRKDSLSICRILGLQGFQADTSHGSKRHSSCAKRFETSSCRLWPQGDARRIPGYTFMRVMALDPDSRRVGE